MIWRRFLLGLLLLLAAPFVVLNTGAGQRWAAGLATRLSGGEVRIEGLSGPFPDRLRVAHLRVADAEGVWLSADDLALDWSPLALLRREARIGRLAAARVAVARRPVMAGGGSGGGGGLPVAIDVEAFAIGRLELGAALAGRAAVLRVAGRARLASLEQGEGELAITRLDAPGSYRARLSADAAGLRLGLHLGEPEGGLIGALAGLPGLVPAGGRLALDATLAGPWGGAALDLRLAAGPLRASARGTLDLAGRAADLRVSASAPAMTPRPDLSWRAVALEARLRGTLAAPEAEATARIDGLHAPGIGGLLAAAPLRLGLHATGPGAAEVSLDHPLLHATGRLAAAGPQRLTLDLPDIAPFAALGGQDLRGRASITATLATAPGLAVTADARLDLEGGAGPLPGLIGRDGRLTLEASRDAAGAVRLSRFALDGAALDATAEGGFTGGRLDLGWTVGLGDLARLAPRFGGTLAARGRVSGPTTDLAAQATLDGRVAVAGRDSGPLHAELSASGLPGRPSGQVVISGTLDGAPLTLAARLARDAAGALDLDLERASWNSLSAEGALALAAGATLPEGRVRLAMTRLADLDRLLGMKLAGSLSAEAVLDRDALRLTLDGSGLAAAGSGVGKLALEARVRDPLGEAQTEAKLRLDGLRAEGTGGSATLSAEGPGDALALKLAADLTGVGGAPLAARAAARLDARARRLDLASLALDWRAHTLRLARPVRISFADGVTLDGLALRLGAASLSVRGRVAPVLDLTARLSDLPASLAGPQFAGTLSAEATLRGPPARPDGRIRLSARGLGMTEGPARTLKPAELVATATLSGGRAALDARLGAGADRITLSGSAPLGAGALALTLRGQVDLTAANAVLAASGRHVTGRVALAAQVAGTTAAPRLSGTLRLSGGELRDIPLGLRLSDIAAVIEGDGQRVRLARFSARAGKGRIEASGTLGLAAPMPVSLQVTAKEAQLLASELVRGSLGAELDLSGALGGAMRLAGSVTLGRTDITVPDSLPAGVASLDVAHAGAPPRRAAPSPDLGLDLRLNAPGQVFVRGRGLDVELHGRLHLHGSAAAPRVDGRFALTRGSFTLAGKRLAFDKGTLRFDGGLPIDPLLDFSATTTGTDIVVTLGVTGHASAPKIALTSVPALPQDEILARLLFDKSATELGPVELAQIASALAQMAGGSGFNPLDKLRAGLGLDRLSVSGGARGQTGGAAVEFGKTIAPGVYLGAKQSATGSGTQATVEIELGRGLKLEAGLGSGGAGSATGSSGSGGSEVGITYQFDY